MKKLLALLLALVMVLSLAACAEEEEESSSRRRKQKETTTEVTEDTAELEETEEVTEAETEPEELDPFGTVDGQVYENAYLGFGIELDPDWSIATQEEAAQMVGVGADVMGIDEQLAKGIYCDLYALTADNTSLNIMLQQENVNTRAFTDEEIMENTLEVTVSQFEGMGMTDIQTKIGEVEFAERDCAVVALMGSMGDVTLYMGQVMWREGDYIAIITVSARDSDNLDVMDTFYSLY